MESKELYIELLNHLLPKKLYFVFESIVSSVEELYVCPNSVWALN